MLSTSERIICGISLQLTVAELSGYNFFIADDLESLDPEYSEVLVEHLENWKKSITAILIGLNLSVTLAGKNGNYIWLQALGGGLSFSNSEVEAEAAA